MSTTTRGGCNCKAVRFELQGEPQRCGVCHCTTCRKETGSPFMAFAVWPRSRMAVTGETRSYTEVTEHRHFCPLCGSSLFATNTEDDDVEVRLGALDAAPTRFTPDHESWVGRRETWLQPIEGTEQHARNAR
jgi:hypothetical protein